MAALAQVTTPQPQQTPPVDPTEVVTQVEDAALNAQIEAVLAQMSAADRVGQLFMVAFTGNDTGFDSDIAELVYGYRIGGVVLSSQRYNFSNAPGTDTPHQIATLTNQLQGLAYGLLLPHDQAFSPLSEQSSSQAGVISLARETGMTPPNLPLLIAVKQLGDGLPQTALRRSFTPLPSEMALGAAWNLDLTRRVGQIVGRELNAVGVNLLLGPDLDVFDQPRADNVGARSLHSFGGNPYWVSQMGRAYIAGVHEGGNGRVATIAGHFPGQGNIDRLPDKEIATVQQSIEEFRQTALVPFRGVTRQVSMILRRDGDLFTSDGLMTSHMRYSALPGRATPISLGPELSMALEQEGFANWHTNGGLIMSNALGVMAIRRYHDPTLQNFPYVRYALDMFSAGHDLIYLDGLSLKPDWEAEKQAIKEIISFFQERYGSDATFAAQVDAAVRRILRLKLRLYGESYVSAAAISANNTSTMTLPVTTTQTMTASTAISLPVIPLDRILTQESDLEILTEEGRADAMMLMGQVARESITLLYPDLASLSSTLPSAPQAEDRLLIFSDSRLLRECDQCTAETALGPEEIAGIINRLYGSAATGQVLPDQIKSYAFSDLDQLLVSTPPPAALADADPTATITVTAAATPTVSVEPTSIEPPVEIVTQTAETLDKNAKLEMAIDESNWIIFAMLDVDVEEVPSSDVVKRFLRQRSDELRGKQVVVFALHAPYFLDATEISTLTAYFGVYGKTRPFLESAVRALFRSYTPMGAPPVSVPGTQFASMSERLQPDPNRPVELRIWVNDAELVLEPEDGELPTVQVGDIVRVRVGPVLDLNGRPVPDGTLVNFELIYEGETIALNIEPAQTRSGQASRELTIDRAGTLQIAARVGSASTGEPVELDVRSAPAADATQTVIATPTVTPTITITGVTSLITMTSPADNPTAAGGDTALENSGRLVNLNSLVITLFTMLITLCLLLIAQVQILPRQVLVHNMLWATAFGLSAYILYALGLVPGAGILQERLNEMGPAIVVFIAMLIPLLWLQLRTEQLP